MATAVTCNGCDYNYFHYIQKFYDNTPNFVEYLQDHGVIPKSVVCEKCKLPCSIAQELNIFYCGRSVQRRVCNFSVSMFAGTFLGYTRLPPWEIALYVNHCLQNFYDFSPCKEFLEWPTRTLVNWHNFCFEVTLNWLYNQESIGGPNIIVEIDQTFFLKIKYERFRKREPNQVWLFGGIERESKKRLIIPLHKEGQDPSAKTLLPIIRKYIRKGSVVISDDWAAFQTLSREGYVHKLVNDPNDRSVHKWTIELQLKKLRNWSSRTGIQTEKFIHYFSGYLFLDTFQDNPYHQFFLEIAKLYKSKPLGSHSFSLTGLKKYPEEE
ncbi:uncharacterized protein [Palaemon carinicauda]|uniref:uncharacterized protein n=1 Tax=Palaemon carinicauda TaxID=392227 RepID=UPI0035B5D0DC